MGYKVKKCARCGTGRLAQATFFDGMDRWCAVASAREALSAGNPIPTEWVRAVFVTLDDERRNAVEEAREAGREARAAQADAEWALQQAEDARW